MIYRNLIRPLSTLSLALIAVILTGCGGAASEDTTTSNKPTPVSAAASSISQAVTESSSSLPSNTTSLSTTSPSSAATFSSKAIASSTSSYVRASRASASAASGPEDFPDEIIIPEKPRDPTDYPPSQPTDAKVLGTSTTEIVIAWSASTDDIGVSRYEIHRNGIYIGSSTAPKLSYQDINLAPNTTYIYTVRAVDTAEHRSAFSSPLAAQTLAASSSSSVKTSSSITSSKISASSQSKSSSPSSKSSSQSKTSSLSSKSSSSQSSKSSISGAFVVDWPIPIRRENGDYLELHEIGGFELRHKLVGSDAYTSIKISNAITSYTFDSAIITSDSVEIAAFDIDGRYSRFIALLPK